MNITTRIPIDVDTLSKGSVISVAEVERITGKTKGSNEYLLAVMGLAQFIERAFLVKSQNVTVCTENGTVRVLSDEDAVTYNQRQFNRALNKAGRAHFRQMGVDTSKLTEQSKVDHERAILVQSRMLTAAAGAKRAALLTVGSERSTPAMLPKGPL